MELKKVDAHVNIDQPFLVTPESNRMSRLGKRLVKDKYLILLLLPGILYFLIYRLTPMLGIVIAFKDYSAFRGLMDSPWWD